MSGYIGTQPVPQATQTRDSFTATSGQTSFATGGYTPNFLDVYLNGVKLASADYTATNGSDVVLASGAATGDILEVVAYTTFTVGSSFTPSIDDNGNATALTIDSSENVLIGTTDATPYDNTSGNGILLGDGLISSAQSGGNAAIFNRMTNDGSIVNFRKDGTSVGSIQSRAGVVSTIILDPRSGSIGTGITGSGANLSPTNGSGVEVDARNDLGKSDYRFKDAYLSGGIYLGGTGSANKLEDYEEGTFTPVVEAYAGTDPTVGYTSRSGSYTKIGNLVFANIIIALSSYSGGTSNILMISGLPFPIGNSATGTLNSRYINFVRLTSHSGPVQKLTDYGVGFLTCNNNTNWAWEYTNILQASSSMNITYQYETTA